MKKCKSYRHTLVEYKDTSFYCMYDKQQFTYKETHCDTMVLKQIEYCLRVQPYITSLVYLIVASKENFKFWTLKISSTLKHLMKFCKCLLNSADVKWGFYFVCHTIEQILKHKAVCWHTAFEILYMCIHVFR